jgi:DNA-binding transcriptional ArsR family regulator
MGGNLVLYHRKEAEKLGLNPTDSNALGFLAETGAIPAGRLAELMGLSTGAITAVLDRLEKAGLVRRESDPDDRRRVLIVPAARGKRGQELSRLFGPLARPFGALVRSYDEEELGVILDFVSRTSDLMREEAEGRNGA